MKKVLLIIPFIFFINIIFSQKSYELIIDYQFDDAHGFYEGLAPIKKWDKWGYIDKKGTLVIDYQYDNAGIFSEGISRVQIGKKWGYIDKKGNSITDCIFSSALTFSDGLALVENPAANNWSKGFINRKGELAIDYQYGSGESFSEGLAAVSSGGKWGFINKQGKWVIEPQFDLAWYGGFSRELARVRNEDGEMGYTDKHGNMVIDYQFDWAYEFDENGLACVKNKDDKCGFIDKRGNIVIACQYEGYPGFSEGLAAVEKYGKCGYIDSQGNVVIDFQFEAAYGFHQGLAVVKLMNKPWGFINKQGEVVIGQFYHVKGFSEGLAPVSNSNKKWGFIAHRTPIYCIQKIVEKNVNKWQEKGKYEKTEDYLARVTDENRKQKAEEFKIEAMNEVSLEFCDWKDIISEYDADNEVSKISVKGLMPFYINIPLSEAQQFEESLKNLEFSEQKYTLSDNGSFVLLHSNVYNPNNSKTYKYDSKEDHQFNVAQIDMNFEPLDISIDKKPVKKPTLTHTSIKVGKSDVDVNIPVASVVNHNTFAVIIGNENYENEIPVKYAIIDALTFKKYAIKTLGIPEKQIHYLQDATFAAMLDEIEWLNSITDAFENEAKIIFYYAGHGMPDETSKSAYLLPVNGTSSRTRTAIQLDELFTKLTEHPLKQVTVILDACFSGSSRNGMIASGRGVKIKPKENLLKGNLVVFSAVSDDETAHPYEEKQHGLFTYFLLKKLKETNGNISYKELGYYITTEVNRLSVINNKEQNPRINVSNSVIGVWENWNMK